MRLILLFLFVFFMITAQASSKKSGTKSNNTRDYTVTTYYYYDGKNMAVESMNSYYFLKEYIKKQSFLYVRKKDARVVQDLLLDKLYSALTRIPIYSYEGEAKSLNLSHSALEEEKEHFKGFKKLLKKYGSFERAMKKKAFWDSLKVIAEEQPACLNYSLLMKMKNGKLQKMYSYVTATDKIFSFNDYFSKFFVVEKGRFKGFNFTLFKSYPAIEKKLKQMRYERTRFPSSISGLFRNVYSFGEYTMRYDAQYGRIRHLDRDLKKAEAKYKRDKNVGSWNRFVGDHNRKVESFNRKIKEIRKDALKVDSIYEGILRKHVKNLNDY